VVVTYANSAIFQLYHGEYKLIFNEMMMVAGSNQKLVFVAYALSTQHYRKDWLARKKDNVSEWDSMFIHVLSFQ
jgi:thiosulfate reductase cytochrome b subunit